MSRVLDRLLKKRRLKDLDVEEISIVDKAANKHRFAIVKRDAALSELLKPFADEDLEALIKANDPKAMKALREALKLLGTYVEGFPEDVAAAVKTLAAFAAPADGADYGYPKKRKGKEDVGQDAQPEDFDSDTDRATFMKAHKGQRRFPTEGTLSDLMGAIIGYARPALAAKWAARRIEKGIESGDIDPADLEAEDIVIDEENGEPHGKSKVLKGQDGLDDEDGAAEDETEDLWPSL